MTIRKPLQIVEIDLPKCTRVFGNSPCTATLSGGTVRKCYNSFATCADKANYDAGTLTLRFSQAQNGLPKTETIFPAMTGPVSGNSAILNIGATDGRTGPLGRRESVTVSLRDFVYSDRLTDPYQSERVDGTAQTDEGGYNPRDRGTFFGKMRVRWPYYVGQPLRVLDGYVGESLGSMRTRHYVITGWKGPSADGVIQIEAKDVLDLADDKKALCPAINTGKLAADVDETSLASFDLTPAGVGAEYAASGRAVIGSEIVTFTRSSDTITLTGRGADGSEAATHATGDTMQECARFDGVTIADAAYDLLTVFAGVDASFITKSDWTDEANDWLASLSLTTTIAEPTGVLTLLGEIAELGVYFWWDRVAQKIRMRANRPVGLGETPSPINETSHILAGSVKAETRDDARVDTVLMYHGQIDPTKDVKDKGNYRRSFVTTDTDAQSADEYGQASFRTIHNRWFGPFGDDANASAITSRYVMRYRDPPKQVSFNVDIGQRASVEIADIVSMDTRSFVDDTGQNVATTCQVMQTQEVEPGAVIAVTAQTYETAGRFGYIMPAGSNDYGSATDEEKKTGFYIIPTGSTEFPDGSAPFVIF